MVVFCLLELASCNITRLPSAIRHLPDLDSLDLSYNGIHGHIPEWIWRNMSSLDLSHNVFTTVGKLPANTTIISLDLSFNNLSGAVPFPMRAQNIDYSNNKFSSIQNRNFLQRFSIVYSINLANNDLSGPLPYMECYSNNGYGVQILDLSSNNFSGLVPPYLLKGCNGLKVLNLRGNRLTGTWPDVMDKSCQLNLIDLHGNRIQGRLPRSLANCNKLQDLDIGGNNFEDSFPTWLGKLSELRLLVLRSNQFYGRVKISLNKKNLTAGYFSSLKIIDLAGNRFTGVLPFELFNNFKSMVRSPLDDEAGGSSYKVTVEVPEEWGSSYQVAIEVAMKQQYMRVPKIFTDLVVIDLSNNRFRGYIPRTIGNLTSLNVLNLSHNAFIGEIPAELGCLSQVESIDLSWNHLTGEIPQTLASLTSLEWLNLSYNDLSGSIPSGIQFSTFPSSSFQGNPGLYGCPLPVRCNLTRSSSTSKAPPPGQVPDGAYANRRFEVIVMCIFVGSGFGVGFALAIVMQVVCIRRRGARKCFFRPH
ncbi:unnamed protein product [Urochloa decumbens]|uniref:Uncharacterized protein n=1 Tax=Urochloa decumbens TaxID=240449 RepID=A0ABC8Z6X8_9POAL